MNAHHVVLCKDKKIALFSWVYVFNLKESYWVKKKANHFDAVQNLTIPILVPGKILNEHSIFSNSVTIIKFAWEKKIYGNGNNDNEW